MLAEILRILKAPDAMYDTSCTSKGCYTYVRAKVERGSQVVDMWIYSDGPMCSAGDAEEEAAQRMISSLKKSLDLEIDDVNWIEKY